MIFSLSALCFLAACGEDDNPKPGPGNNDPRSAYTGSYTVTDTLWIAGSATAPENFVLSITTGNTASDTLYFNNMWNQGYSVYALLSGNFFSFPSQQIDGPYYMTGSGNFNGSALYYSTSGDSYVNHGYGTKQ